MKVIGIDPGIANLGWAVVEKQGLKVLGCGVITTKSSMQHDARLYKIFVDLEAVVDEYDLFTCHMSSERMPYNAKLAATSGIGAVIGVLGLLCSFYQMKRFEYSPMTVKKEAAGNSKADKTHMIEYARGLGWPGKLVEHSADAIALAITHIKAEGNGD
jgi:crossover junction endodeoxyribonuclease RuvC